MNEAYINQPVESAIVPLESFRFPCRFADCYGDIFDDSTGADYVRGSSWRVVWGLYSFKGENGELRYAEARGLVNPSMHDFCGGAIASSFSVYFVPSRSNWGDPTLGSCSPHVKYTDASRLYVPSLHDAVRDCDTLTESQVRDILSRSLCYWTLAVAYSHGRRALFAFDRVYERAQTREILRYAKDIHECPTEPILCGIARMDHVEAYEAWKKLRVVHDAPKNCTPNNRDVNYMYRACDVTVTVIEPETYLNANSGNEVGPICVYFSNGYEDCESEEVYDEELDEYVPVGPTYSRFRLPDWYTPCQTSYGYRLCAPISMFSNG